MFELFIRTNAMTIVSFLYLILVFIFYNLKGKNEKVTSKIFVSVIYFTFILCILFSVWVFLAVTDNNLKFLIGRITTFGFMLWDIILLFYITFLPKDNEKNIEFFKKNKVKVIVGGIVVFVLCLTLSFILDIDIYQTDIRKTFHMGGTLSIAEQCIRNFVVIYAFIIIIKNGKKIESITKVLFGVLMGICVIQVIQVLFGPFKLNDDILINVMTIFFMYLSVESQDKLLLAEYNESVKKSREFNELKSNFMKNISHQIRTPMSIIVGMSEHIIIDNDITEEEVRENTLYVKNASDSLLNLINSIFDMSRIQSNKEIINIDNYCLDSVIFDISSNINSKLKENLIFTINADEICPNDLVGDGHKLCKILNIFLMNAINHTEYGEVSLNVSCTQIDSLNYELTFLIKNSGHSMSNEMFNTSFEDIVEMKNIDHNTINLVVAKSLLDMIGGSIEFINETGKGTQYIIKLKQKLSSQNKLGNIKEKIQTNYDLSHRIINLLGKKVLIVDEDKANIELLSKYLSQYNLIIDSTFEISDCNNLIKNNNYDIVFINAKFDGIDLSNKDIKVIGLVDKINDGKSNNYYDKLNTPFEFRDVNKIINNIYKYGEVK